ncbi:hypothetical protein EYF80_055091 [Liparis tanakae]|uniref:Uncharacterized protein n=1 Tax=Liparis tanakae TaxID=230148 RepID=A0A4Z2F236_9TELE|nr:hypothetical protein EYF80_055091 [Liparis tanakae]
MLGKSGAEGSEEDAPAGRPPGDRASAPRARRTTASSKPGQCSSTLVFFRSRGTVREGEGGLMKAPPPPPPASPPPSSCCSAVSAERHSSVFVKDGFINIGGATTAGYRLGLAALLHPLHPPTPPISPAARRHPSAGRSVCD